MTNPLEDLHQQAEAEFQAYGDLQIVTTFGEPQAEYSAIHKSAALMDEPQRGFLEMTGADRLTFLNSLVSNATWNRDTKTPLPPGEGVYAFLLNAKNGRILCDFNVIERGERTILELDGRLAKPIKATLDRYLFAEKVTIIDRSDDLHAIALIGPMTPTILRDSIDSVIDFESIAKSRSSIFAKVIGQEIILWRDDEIAATTGFHLIVPKTAARAIWMHFVSRFASATDIGKRPLRPIGWAAFNTARIEAGTPLFGIDFDDNTLPAETGVLLNRAVSFTKGCYPGQEVVARMHARGQVAKQLAAFQMADNGALPMAGSHVFDSAQNQIGVVTSSTISPILSGAAIGLALLKKPHFTVGTKLSVPAEGEIRKANVVDAPFVGRESAIQKESE